MRKEPTADEGAGDSDEEVADDPEPGALHDFPGQPSGKEANHHNDQKTVTRHVHLRILQLHQQGDASCRQAQKYSLLQDGGESPLVH